MAASGRGPSWLAGYPSDPDADESADSHLFGDEVGASSAL